MIPSAPSAAETAERPRTNELLTILRRIRDASRDRPAPTYAERIASLEALQKALLGRKDAIVDAVMHDFGQRSKFETLIADVYAVVSAIQHTQTHLRSWMDAEDRETSWVFLPSTSQVQRQPLGVVGIISPWNYPVQLALSPLVAALGAGNRAMIKPSELVPTTAELLAELLSDAFANDYVAVVTGGPDVGEAFAHLPFDHLIFTGSTRVGKRVMRAASENLVPVTLELGGKSPAIVGRDFNTASAASRIMTGKTFNAGQTCVAPDYALIPSGTQDAFVMACRTAVNKAYPSIATNPDYTAIVNDSHYGRVRSYLTDAVDRGATTIELIPSVEGSAEALARARKIPPTLVLEPTDDMVCMQEEIFGPVLPVVTYENLADAIQHVNARPRPLAIYYFGHERSATDQVLAETTSGGVTINETMLHVLQDDLPFGGVGQSGMGQYHGRDGFDALSKKKPIFHQSRIRTTALLRPPYGKVTDRILAFLIGK